MRLCLRQDGYFHPRKYRIYEIYKAVGTLPRLSGKKLDSSTVFNMLRYCLHGIFAVKKRKLHPKLGADRVQIVKRIYLFLVFIIHAVSRIHHTDDCELCLLIITDGFRGSDQSVAGFLSGNTYDKSLTLAHVVTPFLIYPQYTLNAQT